MDDSSGITGISKDISISSISDRSGADKSTSMGEAGAASNAGAGSASIPIALSFILVDSKSDSAMLNWVAVGKVEASSIGNTTISHPLHVNGRLLSSFLAFA
jgi:hypothetical protein